MVTEEPFYSRKVWLLLAKMLLESGCDITIPTTVTTASSVHPEPMVTEEPFYSRKVWFPTFCCRTGTLPPFQLIRDSVGHSIAVFLLFHNWRASS